MSEPTLRFAPGVPGLAALGARRFADVMGDTGALLGEARAQLVARSEGRALLRLPLPGTPDARGRPLGRPGGAGTGLVYLRRFEGAPLRAALRARLTPPRSSSLAAREWNLLCRLRALGVGAPEPLAVGEAGAGPFARRSFLVTRGLEPMLPLGDWLALNAEPDERRRLARALGLALQRALDGGVWLPRLAAEHVFVGDRGRCEHGAPVAGLRSSRLPEVALAGLRDGRLLARVGPARRAAWLARVERTLPADARLSGRERLRVLRLALGRGAGRERRRTLLKRWIRRAAAARA